MCNPSIDQLGIRSFQSNEIDSMPRLDLQLACQEEGKAEYTDTGGWFEYWFPSFASAGREALFVLNTHGGRIAVGGAER